jgi:hypothetical protein
MIVSFVEKPVADEIWVAPGRGMGMLRSWHRALSSLDGPELAILTSSHLPLQSIHLLLDHQLRRRKTATMGVPFEALLPYGIMIGMFAFTGGAMAQLQYMQNGGKRHRYGVDTWDKQMMERDRRLTGYLRGQTDKAAAPPGFELNNPWRVEYRYF